MEKFHHSISQIEELPFLTTYPAACLVLTNLWLMISLSMEANCMTCSNCFSVNATLTL